MNDAPAPSSVARTASVTTAPTGPYLVRGPLALTDAAGNEMVVPAGKSVALCRCGRSQTKPFCDGTHTRVGFEGREPAPSWALERFGPDGESPPPPGRAHG